MSDRARDAARERVTTAVRLELHELPRLARIELLASLLIEDAAFCDQIKVWQPPPAPAPPKACA